MNKYRRICAYCKTDMGPAGDNFTGHTHGTCLICFSIVMIKMDASEDIMNYKPAGKSDICDAYEINPDHGLVVGAPRLIRCRCRAVARITIKTASEVAALKRCLKHADELRDRALNGKFEILEDEPVKERIGA